MTLALARLSSSAREAFGAQQFGLVEQFLLHQRGLLGRGAGVKGEIAGGEADEVLRADVIGEAEFLPDAQEQPRAEVAAGFVQQFQRIAVGVAEGRAAEADDQHGLFLVAGFGDALDSSLKCCSLESKVGLRRGGFQAAKAFSTAALTAVGLMSP